MYRELIVIEPCKSVATVLKKQCVAKVGISEEKILLFSAGETGLTYIDELSPRQRVVVVMAADLPENSTRIAKEIIEKPQVQRLLIMTGSNAEKIATQMPAKASVYQKPTCLLEVTDSIAAEIFPAESAMHNVS